MGEYQDYADTMAEYDFDEQRLRRLLAQKLALSAEERQQSLTTGRENNSARGILQSTVALDDQTKRNTEYTREDANTNQAFADDLGVIGRGRISATSAYNAYLAEQKRLAALEHPLVETVDPSDPLGWKKIAEEQRLAGNPNFTGQPVEDPLNWKNIAEEQAKLGNPAFTRPPITPTASFNPITRRKRVTPQTIFG